MWGLGLSHSFGVNRPNTKKVAMRMREPQWTRLQTKICTERLTRQYGHPDWSGEGQEKAEHGGRRGRRLHVQNGDAQIQEGLSESGRFLTLRIDCQVSRGQIRVVVNVIRAPVNMESKAIRFHPYASNGIQSLPHDLSHQSIPSARSGDVLVSILR